MSDKASSYSPAKAYGRVGLHSEVDGATPHRLVQMLMEGALTRLLTARGSMQRSQVQDKGKHIGVAIDIVQTLQASLNYDDGGAIAEHLGQLYDYCIRTLLLAHRHDDIARLDEVHRLLSEIKTGWDGISPQSQKGTAPPRTDPVSGPDKIVRLEKVVA